MLVEAEKYAIAAHGDQMYGDKPYRYHLEKVVAVASLYTEERHLLIAAWLHDVIEDTGVTYFDLTRSFGVPTAQIVWGCTGTGVNRKARQQSIRAKIELFPGTAFVKLADRIANIANNVETGNFEKFIMYNSEHFDFGPHVAHLVPKQMYVDYVKLLQSGCEKFNLHFQGSSVDRFYI